MKKENIDFERGEEDIVFVHLEDEIDTSEIAQAEKPRKRLEKEMSTRGLEWDNARIIGIFSDEFSLQLLEEPEIKLDDEQIYP